MGISWGQLVEMPQDEFERDMDFMNLEALVKETIERKKDAQP